MLSVPVLRVLLSQAGTKPTPSQQPARAAQATLTDLSPLEELARQQPTPANRLNLSRALVEQKQPDRATAVLEPLVAQDPANANAWNNLCIARIQKQEFAAAVTNCNKALALNPASQLFQNNRKWAQGELDKTLQTLKLQEQVPAPNRNAAYYLSRGLNFYHAGKYIDALQAWQKSHELNPKDAQTENNIGVADMMLLQYSDAEEAFRRALALDPSSDLAKNNLAWANAKKQANR